MSYISCRERTFRYQLDTSTFYGPYLRWLCRLSERLGEENALMLWENTFVDVDDEYLLEILSSGWQPVVLNDSKGGTEKFSSSLKAMISRTRLNTSEKEIRNVIENSPPIYQIKNRFANHIMEREISAYAALHLRFDGLACLAEKLIELYGKQGELMVYDLLVQERLADAQGATGSVEQFIANFTAKPDSPNVFTAGLEIELIRETDREVVINVCECEWARYFLERHPLVGYLMACSTDEAAYRAYNQDLRMQRTQTIMEGAEKCDFRIFAV